MVHTYLDEVLRENMSGKQTTHVRVGTEYGGIWYLVRVHLVYFRDYKVKKLRIILYTPRRAWAPLPCRAPGSGPPSGADHCSPVAPPSLTKGFPQSLELCPAPPRPASASFCWGTQSRHHTRMPLYYCERGKTSAVRETQLTSSFF